jgi:hypothetical protein
VLETSSYYKIGFIDRLLDREELCFWTTGAQMLAEWSEKSIKSF